MDSLTQDLKTQHSSDPDEDHILEQVAGLRQLIQSSEWKFYVELLRKHKAWLQDRAWSNLKEHNDRVAGEYRARMEECDQMIKLINQRLTELTGGKK